MGNPLLRQVFVAGHIGKLLEQAGKMKFRKACQISQLLDRNVFRAMVGDIVANHHEFFNIFMLLTVGNTGKSGVGIEAGTSQSNKKTNHERVNTGFREGNRIIIFPDDLV